MWIDCNPNPSGKKVDDCAIRALALAEHIEWDEASMYLSAKALALKNTQTSIEVMHAVLKEFGYKRYVIPDECPDCYTAEDFANDHPKGVYILGFYNHVATVRDGNILDTWDSSKEVPMLYWSKE